MVCVCMSPHLSSRQPSVAMAHCLPEAGVDKARSARRRARQGLSPVSGRFVRVTIRPAGPRALPAPALRSPLSQHQPRGLKGEGAASGGATSQSVPLLTALGSEQSTHIVTYREPGHSAHQQSD